MSIATPRICCKALESLLKSATNNDYVIENYLLRQLVNVLEKAEVNDQEGVALYKNILGVESQIKLISVLNNFFQYLKELNEGELQD